MASLEGLPEWAVKAIREMRKLKPGDRIVPRLAYFRAVYEFRFYEVRGRVDDHLVVRHRYKNCPWDYSCLSPAWWDTIGRERFRIVKKAKP